MDYFKIVYSMFDEYLTTIKECSKTNKKHRINMFHNEDIYILNVKDKDNNTILETSYKLSELQIRHLINNIRIDFIKNYNIGTPIFIRKSDNIYIQYFSNENIELFINIENADELCDARLHQNYAEKIDMKNNEKKEILQNVNSINKDDYEKKADYILDLFYLILGVIKNNTYFYTINLFKTDKGLKISILNNNTNNKIFDEEISLDKESIPLFITKIKKYYTTTNDNCYFEERIKYDFKEEYFLTRRSEFILNYGEKKENADEFQKEIKRSYQKISV